MRGIVARLGNEAGEKREQAHVARQLTSVLDRQSGAFRMLFLLRNLQQVATRVIEHGGNHRTKVCRRLHKMHALFDERFVRGVHISHGERVKRNPVFHQRIFERRHRRMRRRFEHNLRTIRAIGRHHSEPPMFAERNVVLYLEAERLCVEVKGFRLVVDKD